jgi:hypothetical protein
MMPCMWWPIDFRNQRAALLQFVGTATFLCGAFSLLATLAIG